MINIHSEDLLDPAEAARSRPCARNGRPTHISTLYRWMMRGVRGIRLKHVRIGGRIFTSKEALQRFADRLTTPKVSGTSSHYSATPSREVENPDQRLSELGF